MRTAGVALILLTLTALWLYNTGRLEAVLSVIHDPSVKPGKTQYVAGLGAIPAGGMATGAAAGGAGGSNPQQSGGFAETLGNIFGNVDIFGGDDNSDEEIETDF